MSRLIVLTAPVWVFFALVSGCGDGKVPLGEPGEEAVKGGPQQEEKAEPKEEGKVRDEDQPETEGNEKRARKKVFVREGAERIDLDKEKVFLLPVVAYGFASIGINETEFSAGLTAGNIMAFRSTGISLVPLKPLFESSGLGGMARELAYGAYHCIDAHGSFELATDPCGKGIEKVPASLAKLVVLIEEKMSLYFEPRHLYALYIWGYGPGPTAGTVRCRVIGTIYDVQEDLVHSCVHYARTITRDTALPEAARIPENAFKLLMKEVARRK